MYVLYNLNNITAHCFVSGYTDGRIILNDTSSFTVSSSLSLTVKTQRHKAKINLRSNESERVAGVVNENDSTLKIKRSALFISVAHLISYSLYHAVGLKRARLQNSSDLLEISLATPLGLHVQHVGFMSFVIKESLEEQHENQCKASGVLDHSCGAPGTLGTLQ